LQPIQNSNVVALPDLGIEMMILNTNNFKYVVYDVVTLPDLGIKLMILNVVYENLHPSGQKNIKCLSKRKKVRMALTLFILFKLIHLKIL
jgi:hypothetical protein